MKGLVPTIMANQTIRFVVRADGVEKLLFGVRPYSDGSIGIILAVNGFTMRDTGETAKELHFSAHSPRFHEDVKKFGYRMTARFKSESAADAGSDVVVVKRKRKPFVWMVAGTAASMSSAKPARKRNTIPILAVDPKSTIVYIVYVSEPEVSLPQLQGFSLVSIVVGIWRVSTYFSVSSVPDNVIQLTQASPMQPPTSPDFPCGGWVNSMSYDGIESNVQQVCLLLLMGRDGITPGFDPAALAKTFNRWPLIQSDDDLDYGQASRITNPTFINKKRVDGSYKSAEEVAAATRREGEDFIRRMMAARTAALHRYVAIAHPSRRPLIEAVIANRQSDEPDIEMSLTPQGFAIRRPGSFGATE